MPIILSIEWKSNCCFKKFSIFNDKNKSVRSKTHIFKKFHMKFYLSKSDVDPLWLIIVVVNLQDEHFNPKKKKKCMRKIIGIFGIRNVILFLSISEYKSFVPFFCVLLFAQLITTCYVFVYFIFNYKITKA